VLDGNPKPVGHASLSCSTVSTHQHPVSSVRHGLYEQSGIVA